MISLNELALKLNAFLNSLSEQQYLDHLVSYAAGSIILLCACLLGVFFALIRNRAEIKHFLPWTLLVASSCGILVFEADQNLFIIFCSSGLISLILVAKQLPRVNSEQFIIMFNPLYFITLVGFLSAYLIYNLSGYAGTLLVWEDPIGRDFAQAYYQGYSIIGFAVRRLLWDLGLMSRGQDSFLYGVPTYALLTEFGFNAWNLRISAVVMAILTLLTSYPLGRRFFSPFIALGFALFIGFNPSFLYYARYGSSGSATYFSILLSTYFIWRVLKEPASFWVSIAVCISLYLATLHYAPGRLVVMLYLFLISLESLRSLILRRWLKSFYLFSILLCAFAVFQGQKFLDHDDHFLNARGEQLFHMLRHRDYVHDYLKRVVAPENLTITDKIEFTLRVAERNFKDFARLLSPLSDIIPVVRGADQIGDPPRLRLYLSSLFPFVLVGIVYSLYNIKNYCHLSLVLWSVLAVAPLLLTTRFDVHRGLLCVVPLSIWTALGFERFCLALRRTGIFGFILHLILLSFSFCLIIANLRIFFTLRDIPINNQLISQELARIDGPVALVASLDHSEVGWLALEIFERTRQNFPQKSYVLDDNFVGFLRGDLAIDAAEVPSYWKHIRETLSQRTIVFAPKDRYQKIELLLEGHNCTTRIVGSKEFPILLVEPCALESVENSG